MNERHFLSPWQEATGYIIYPDAFYDSNGDGVGDLQGIIQKLDYLHDLGIDLIWICPFFASPMDDNGYDVSSYYDVDPRFGSNEDFQEMLDKAHSLGIRIIIDFVLNHTSDEHPWFKKAIEDPSSEEASYYYFLKGRRTEKGIEPPNNWRSYFSESAWNKVPGSEDTFYLHLFSKKMPDVNWSYPPLREKYFEIARHYLDMGIDGFRLDAISHLGKDLSFSDSSLPVGPDGLVLDPSKYANREDMYQYLGEFKEKVLSHYDCLTIGEAGGGISPKQSLRLTNKHNGLINMAFNFDTAWCNGAFASIDRKDEEIYTRVIELKDNFKKWYDETRKDVEALPMYWTDHDHPRALSQYGTVELRKQSMKMLISTLLFSYGVPFMLYGDEIGMSNVQFDKPEDFYADISSKNEVAYLRSQGYSDSHIAHYLCRTSRINGRQPMQWNSSDNAGFSIKEGRVKANPNAKEGVNVLDEENDPDSILNFTKLAIKLRKREENMRFLRYGRYDLYDHNHPDVYGYFFELNEEKLVVIASFSKHTTYFSFHWRPTDVILHNYDDFIYIDHVFTLRPFECIVMKAY